MKKVISTILLASVLLMPWAKAMSNEVEASNKVTNPKMRHLLKETSFEKKQKEIKLRKEKMKKAKMKKKKNHHI